MTFVWAEGRAYTLPSSPNTGDTVVIGDRIWTWDGDKWVITAVSTLPAGANTQIQYNNNGAFGASTRLAYNTTTALLTLSGSATITKFWPPDTPLNIINPVLGNTADISITRQVTSLPSVVVVNNASDVNQHPMMTGVAGYSVTAHADGGCPSYVAKAGAYTAAFCLTGSLLTLIPINTAVLVTDAPGGISFITQSANEKMRITEAGLVGIGRTNPAYTLDVNGDCNLSAGSVYRINGVPIGGSSSQWTDVTGGIAYTSGNVGIGTTTPSAFLTVHVGNLPTTAGSALMGLDLSANTANVDMLRAFPFRTSDGNGWNTVLWRLGRQVDYASAIADVEFGTGTIALRTNDLTRMTVAANGDVGIGNNGTGPFSAAGFSQLIVGPIGVISATGNTVANFDIAGQFAFANHANPGADKRVATITALLDGSVSSGMLNFTTYFNGTGVERMRITATGNVGIGESNPQASLHATRSDGGYQLMLESAGSQLYGIAIAGGANPELLINDVTNAVTRVTVSSNGAVGIGTTTPTGTAGDLTVQRTATPQEGAVFFGSSGYIYFTGTGWAFNPPTFNSGITFNGNVNVTGEYQINGAPFVAWDGAVGLADVARRVMCPMYTVPFANNGEAHFYITPSNDLMIFVRRQDTNTLLQYQISPV